MRKLLRRLFQDTTRSVIYLIAGAALLVVVIAGFTDAWTTAQRNSTANALGIVRVKATPTPVPERYVPPAEIKFPIY